jgi:hypothetical protein
MPDKVEERSDEELTSLLGPGATARKKQPLRSSFPGDPQGQSDYIDSLRTYASAERERAKDQIERSEARAKEAKSTYSALENLKRYVLDPALSVGAVAAPGVGTALNAAVKGVDAATNASEGNYVSAGLNAADAILPAAKLYAPSSVAGGQAVDQAMRYFQNPATGFANSVFKSAPVSRVMNSVSNAIASSPAALELASVLSPQAAQLSRIAVDTAMRSAQRKTASEFDSASSSAVDYARKNAGRLAARNPYLAQMISRIAGLYPNLISVTGR